MYITSFMFCISSQLSSNILLFSSLNRALITGSIFHLLATGQLFFIVMFSTFYFIFFLRSYAVGLYVQFSSVRQLDRC